MCGRLTSLNGGLNMVIQIIIQIILDTLMPAVILMLATLGIVLIFKTSYTTNFAQGSIAALAVYVVSSASTLLASIIPGISPLMQLILGIVVGIIAAFLFGLFIDTMILRRSKYINSGGKQMITMGIVLIITGLVPLIFGTLARTVPKIVYGNIDFTMFGANFWITKHNLISIIIATVVISVIFIMLRFTKWGLGVRATASNELVASMMGVNTHFITAMSWSIAGALGALSASLYAPIYGNLSSAMMTNVQVNGFLASILGGFSTFYGPIVGSYIIPTITGMVAYISALWKNVIVYGLILIIILIKPIGLFGKKIQKKV